jgi:undecaprenyl diphosphate synthase
MNGGLHVAIIMDGNGRWALAQGLPRSAGHCAGVEAVQRVIEAAPRLGIRTLTLFVFSAANWHRPQAEVRGLLDLFESFFRAETSSWVERGVRVTVVGQRKRLPLPLQAAIDAAEEATAKGGRLHLRFALDYSSREAILGAAEQVNGKPVSQQMFSRLLAQAMHSGLDSPDVDLLIRTGGEQRLSDFLLWETAHAELLFTRRMWPEFDAADLEAAVKEFHSRDRRFGRLRPAQSPK